MDPARLHRREPVGFPAHAGMDRSCGVASPGSSWVSPPTRGWTHGGHAPATLDELTCVPDVVSPPTRGWTRCSERLSGAVVAGFPRPRGDGPRESTAVQDVARCPGFPAHAGMDPGDVCDAHRPRGFPAHAGMDPSTRGLAVVRTLVSPPTRGWTRYQRAFSVARSQRFPRPRGDGPVRSAGELQFTARFPRPRGDGPLCDQSLDHSSLGVSPPTRGWTRMRGCGTFISVWPAVSPPTRGWTRGQRAAPAALRFPRPRGDGPRLGF